MIVMIMKIFGLVEALLDRFVTVVGGIPGTGGVAFMKDGDQWTGGMIPTMTAKGNLVIDSVVTIIHYGLDFVAQFMVMLPLTAGTAINTTYP